jgi:putative ABC transport system ATP-binding protein
MTNQMVEVDNVAKVYHKEKIAVTVLENLRLNVAAGEFVALMGPSGSGKTTLLHLIAGIDRATRGTVKVAGQDLGKLSGTKLANWRARHVGLIFQSYNLISMLSAQQNVELPLMLTRLTKKERQRQVQLALSLVGLEERANHRPAQLSGGQEQRVAVARAIVTDPDVLLCDEPTGNLDRESADDVLNILSRLNREQGKTVVMVTHDPRAADHAHSTLHLDKGRLIEEAAA